MKLIYWTSKNNVKHNIVRFKDFGFVFADVRAFDYDVNCFFVIDENKNITSATYKDIVEFLKKTEEYKLALWEDILNTLKSSDGVIYVN